MWDAKRQRAKGYSKIARRHNEYLDQVTGELFEIYDQFRRSGATAEKEYILVRAEHKVHRIAYEDILYMQSMREYVAYYTTTGRILSLNSLKKLEEVLPNDKFIRIHKSYMVPTSKVEALEGNMVHIGAEKIPIGASYREHVVKVLF